MGWILSPLFWQFVAFVLLIVGGVLHFYFDVLQPYLMETQKKELKTVSFLGLHSFYASGMVLTGIINLYIALFHPLIFEDLVYVAFLFIWALVWASGAFLFMDMKAPKINMAIFLLTFILSVIL